MNERPPIVDWASDFNHTDPRWTENPFPIWDNPLIPAEIKSGLFLTQG